MTPEKIKGIEAHYNARHVGYFGIPGRDMPMEVFYVENPDRSLGHDNYFGIFQAPALLDFSRWTWVITSAARIREAAYPAIDLGHAMLVSRHRHDYVTAPMPDGGEAMLDGGGEYYTRYNPRYPPTHTLTIVDGLEVFTPIKTVSTEKTNDRFIDDVVPEVRHAADLLPGQKRRKRTAGRSTPVGSVATDGKRRARKSQSSKGAGGAA